VVILDVREIKKNNKVEQWVCLDGCAERGDVLWARRNGRKVKIKVEHGGWFPIGKVVEGNGRGK